MDQETKNEIELEVSRLLAKRQDNFQGYIERSTKHFIWLISTLSVIITALIFYFFGNKAEDLESRIDEGVKDIVVAHKIDRKIQDKLDTKMGLLLKIKKEEMASRWKEITNGIDDSLNNILDAKIPDIEANVVGIIHRYQGKELEKIFKQKLDQTQDLDRIPNGTIIASYGAGKPVPVGWVICNGLNGSPDLRNRFIMGSTIKDAGKTGGNLHHSHEFNLKLSPLEHNWKYTSSKQHAILTEDSEKSHEQQNLRNTAKSFNIPPHMKLVYLYKV